MNSAWYESFGEEAKQRIFAAMRDLGAEYDALFQKERALRAPFGQIEVGAEAFDAFLKADAKREFLSLIRAGHNPGEAERQAKSYAADAVRNHNGKRKKDIHWQRWEGMADTWIEDSRRKLERVL